MTDREKDIKRQIVEYVNNEKRDLYLDTDEYEDLYLDFDDYVVIANMLNRLEKIEKS
jgi:hypothetical protein